MEIQVQETPFPENTVVGDGSVCIRGLAASKKHTGKWKACLLTIVCSSCLALAYTSIGKNLVSYLTEVLHDTNVVAARNVSIWHGTTYLAPPLVGAFIADSYLGKYRTILISCTILIIGVLMLVLSGALPLISTYTHILSSQHIIFFSGLYMVAIGYGAQKPCLTSFGADQFDDTDEEERTKRSSYFNWQFFMIHVGSLASGTIVVWVQDNKGWLWGFSIAAVSVALGVCAFLLGSSLYRFRKQGGSPVLRICQVIVATTRNINKDLPSDRSLLYETLEQGSEIEGTRKLEHTTGLGFFDKAAIVTPYDAASVTKLNPWRTCTITQVEEFKVLIRMLPIWATMILFHTVMEQMFSTFIEQGMVMDKRIGSFDIPTASIQSINVITVLALVPVYEIILIPVFRKATGMANGITPLQRMGVGLVFSVLSMISAAFVETNRLHIAQTKGLVHRKVAVPMSIMWQGPQYFLIGAGEVFLKVGLTEFFHEEAPGTMRSLCLGFSLAIISAGNYLRSLIISLVPVFTARGGSVGWIPDNLNDGHLDRFYWMLAVLSFLNLGAFVFCAVGYKCKKPTIWSILSSAI